MNTLFVNLTRFGDLLQTQPAISASAQQGQRIGLYCLENFAPASVLLRDVEHIQPLNGARYLAQLGKDWRRALLLHRCSVRESVKDFPPDKIVGLTASLSARVLGRQLVLAAAAQGQEPPEILGFGLDEHGFDSNAGLWTIFLQAATKKRGCSPFNVVDLFCKASGLDRGPWPNELCSPPEEARQAAAAALGELPAGYRGYAGLQLGASQDRRRWPVARFAALGRLLAEQLGLLPLLLGSQGERELAERYLAQGAPAVDCVGKTGLQELAALVERCELLVSNDTGTMHLAAGLGRPVAGIFLATAQPWDTGPYLPGSLGIEPDMDCHPCEFGTDCPHNLECRQRIPVATVFAAAQSLVQQEAPATTQGARVWRTERQEAGYMGLKCLSHHEADDRTQWVRLQRHIYRHFLDQEAVPPLLQPSGLSQAAKDDALATLAAAEQLLTLMQQQAAVLMVAPREPVKKKFLATWQRVQGLFSQSSFFNVLSYLFAAESQQAGREMSGVQAFTTRYLDLVASWKSLLQS